MHTSWKYKAYPQKAVEKLAARVRAEWLSYKEREKSTQTEFAARLGISQSALNQFLNGTTPISNAMIIQICSELGVNPKGLVKGIKFFEPFFDHIVSTRAVQVRYLVGASKTRKKAVTGEFIHYHAALKDDVDVYAIEVADDVYEPRYFKNEKVIVAAMEPVAGDEAFIMRTDGKSCITKVTEDNLVCLKRIYCQGCDPLTSIDDSRIEFAHKVIGMSK